MYYMKESLLDDLVRIARGEIGHSLEAIVPYVGAHIHGLVTIDEDIEAIYISNKEVNDQVRNAASVFYSHHPKVDIIFFD